MEPECSSVLALPGIGQPCIEQMYDRSCIFLQVRYDRFGHDLPPIARSGRVEQLCARKAASQPIALVTPDNFKHKE